MSCPDCIQNETELRKLHGRGIRDAPDMEKLRDLLDWSRLEMQEFLTIGRVPEKTRKALGR